ncbi:MAG: 16S rRNA (guanine(527)-N(7))-methyltransferase RsmG [Deltaproteobacteria bacterium]|nr:16S rRNA (guanine(527)-N(7))-methyltransferase RsmG [Deltaproteobacteria bacterium]
MELKHGELARLLEEGAAELGVGLDEAAIAAFSAYLDELKAWNRRINLTSIDSDREAVVRHFLDSLTPYRHIKGAGRLLDIGAGAGFPGIPLKIADPFMEVTLVDSVEKKVHFMRNVIRKLGLKGIEAVSGRVEDRSLIARYAFGFDCVISRAFTGLKRFLELSLPYLKGGGSIVAMKGPSYKDELEEACGIKGLEPPQVYEVKVPFEQRSTTLVIFKKR